MKEDFSFVKVGLDKIPIGLANRREIISTISDFKDSMVEAFKEKYDVTIRFNSSMQILSSTISHLQENSMMIGLPGMVKNPTVPRLIKDEVVVYVHDRGVRIFGYELNPVTGYPVNLKYMGKTVECESNAELLGAIKEAYEYALVDLTKLCKDISTR